MSKAISKLLTLRSSDGEVFEVEETVASQSQTLKSIIEDGIDDGEIPVPNVTGPILSKVIDYCKKHLETPTQSDADKDDAIVAALKEWDDEFVKDLDQPTLFNLILAANYLNIKDLLDLTCQTVADTIKDWSPEAVREYFGIENDFTPEEEAAIRKEYAWAFEKTND